MSDSESNPHALAGDAVISFTGITKRFGRRVAVDDVSLEVPRGSVFGLLGHNGAGKSTVIGIILGQILQDSGSVRIHGFDIAQDRARALSKLGAIYETPAFYDYLSGERNLRIFCEYTARTDFARLKEIIHLVGLTERIKDKVQVYSHGMRQRLAIAQALLPRPEVLIFDEPTEGLDPEGIVETRNLILKLQREWGMTILISSHQLSEMEQVCTHLAVMKEGRLRFSGAWRELAAPQRVVIKVDRQAEAAAGLAEAGLVAWTENGMTAQLQPSVTIAAVAEWLVRRGFAVERIAAEPRSLEDFYLETIHLTGQAPAR